MRDLTDREGGFYSAEDADSVPPEQAGDPSAHKSEGAFYIWTDAEIGAVTGGDAAMVRRRFGIEADGNAPQDPQGEFTGRNLLYIAQTVDDIALRTGVTPEAVAEALGRARAQLFAVRAHRPRPHLDDKVLTAWNGLMIAAFARAARVLAGRATRSAVSRGRTAGRRVHPPDALDRIRAAAAASLSRRRGGDRRLRGGLRLSDRAASSSCSRPTGIPRGSSGRRRCRPRRIACSGTRPTLAGSARPATIRACCCASRRTTTAPSRPPDSISVLNLAHVRVTHRWRRVGRRERSAPWRDSAPRWARPAASCRCCSPGCPPGTRTTHRS